MLYLYFKQNKNVTLCQCGFSFFIMVVQKSEIKQAFFFWQGGRVLAGIYLNRKGGDFFQIPYQATTANLLLEILDFEQVYSSYPSLALLPCWQSPFHYQMRLHQATFVHVNVKRIHVHATVQSLSLREEGELVCNWVTPVG